MNPQRTVSTADILVLLLIASLAIGICYRLYSMIFRKTWNRDKEFYQRELRAANFFARFWAWINRD